MGKRGKDTYGGGGRGRSYILGDSIYVMLYKRGGCLLGRSKKNKKKKVAREKKKNSRERERKERRQEEERKDAGEDRERGNM